LEKPVNIPFAKKTVDGVMSAFTKTLADLEEVRTRELEEARVKRAEAERLHSEARAAELEAQRAIAVSEKLQSLVAA
jgi:hypothetical protein